MRGGVGGGAADPRFVPRQRARGCSGAERRSQRSPPPHPGSVLVATGTASGGGFAVLAPPPRPSPAASQPRGSLLPPEPCVCVRGWAAQRSVHPQPRPPSAPRGITGVVVLLRPSSGGGKRHADYTSQRASRAAKEPMGARDGRRPGYIKRRPTRRASASPGSAERSSAAAEERCGAERSEVRCAVCAACRARAVRAGGSLLSVAAQGVLPGSLQGGGRGHAGVSRWVRGGGGPRPALLSAVGSGRGAAPRGGLCLRGAACPPPPPPRTVLR